MPTGGTQLCASVVPWASFFGRGRYTIGYSRSCEGGQATMPTGSFELGAPGTCHDVGTDHASRSPGLTPCALTSVGACWSRSSLRVVAEASLAPTHTHTHRHTEPIQGHSARLRALVCGAPLCIVWQGLGFLRKVPSLDRALIEP